MNTYEFIYRLFFLHNEVRTNFGLKPLLWSPALYQSAMVKATNLMDLQYFSHFSPSGGAPWKIAEEFGLPYQIFGENLAYSFSSPSHVMEAWMMSKTHRENILDPKFTHIGIAILTGQYFGKRQNVIVVHFARLKKGYYSKQISYFPFIYSCSIDKKPIEGLKIERVKVAKFSIRTRICRNVKNLMYKFSLEFTPSAIEFSKSSLLDKKALFKASFFDPYLRRFKQHIGTKVEITHNESRRLGFVYPFSLPADWYLLFWFIIAWLLLKVSQRIYVPFWKIVEWWRILVFVIFLTILVGYSYLSWQLSHIA